MSTNRNYPSPDALNLYPNRVLDFGPPLTYTRLCPAYTVERVSVWSMTTEKVLEIVALNAPELPKARAEGILYGLTDEELFALDSVRQIGVNCDRKRVPVLLPPIDTHPTVPVGLPINQKTINQRINSKIPQHQQTHAWVYFGYKEVWLEQIEFDRQQNSCGRFQDGGVFQPLDQVPDPSGLLNRRTCFISPVPEPNKVYSIPENIRKHVRKRNRAEARRLYFKELGNRMEKALAPGNVREKLRNFVKDE